VDGTDGSAGGPPKTEAMTGAARQRWTLITAILGLNITILDETVVFLALPAINRDLRVSLNGQEWIVNAYLLSLSALLLLGGSSFTDWLPSVSPPWHADWRRQAERSSLFAWSREPRLRW